MAARPLLYLIDGSSQMYRAYHAPIRTAEGGLLRNAQGRPTNAVYIFVTMLRKLMKDFAPEFIAASFDLPGRTFRDDLAADYKANRAPMPDELAEQIPMVHAACEALGVPILTSERYEADDVIGTLTMKAAAAGFDVAIVTSDKDFYQLVQDGIRVFNPRDEGTWYDAAGVKEKFGVAPEQVVDVLALMGDTIDNIKGVPGIGEKGARELISQYGTLENLIAHASEVKNKRSREGLLAHARRCAAEPASRAHPHRRAGVVRAGGPAVPRRIARALLRDFQRDGIPHARHRVRADRRLHRQELPHRQYRRRRARAGGEPARGRTLLAARAGGSAVGDARVDRRAGVLDGSTRRAIRAGRTPRAGRRRQRAAGGRARGAGAGARGSGRLERRARREVRHDRAGATRRDAARRGHRHDDRQLSARRDAVGAPARRSRARAHQLQGADRGGRLRPRRESALAGRPAAERAPDLRRRARGPRRSARADLPRSAGQGAVDRGVPRRSSGR